MSQFPGPPAPGQQPPPPAGPPNNNLVWAILTTIFCCLPLGIASIVFAAQVNGKWQAGDFAGAQESADKARKFALWGTIAGLIVVPIVIILQFMAVDTTSTGM